MPRFIVVSVYGAVQPEAPIFAGYQVPEMKKKKAFCVLDRDKSALVWISCSYIDYTTFLRSLNEHGLNQCEVKFTSDIYTWDGEGTVGNMKVMPNGTDVKVSEAKVRYIRNMVKFIYKCMFCCFVGSPSLVQRSTEDVLYVMASVVVCDESAIYCVHSGQQDP